MTNPWAIFELRQYLAETVWYLTRGENGAEQHWNTLKSLAVVHSTFTSPATRYIWHTLPNLRPVLRLMPSLVWSSGKITEIINSELTEDDWEAISRYASNVRILNLEVGCTTATRPQADLILTQFLARQQQVKSPLFPNLQTLQAFFNHVDSSVDQYLQAFLSHTVQEIEFVTMYGNGREVNHLAPIITSATSRIKTFIFRRPLDEEDSGLEMEDLVLQLDHLERLQILDYTLSTKGIRHLSALPNLRRLEFCVSMESSITLDQTPTFPNLEQLGLRGHGNDCLHFLSSITSPRLSHLSIETFDNEDNDYLPSMVNLISTTWPSSLTTLQFHLEPAYPESDEDHLTFTLFRPLLKCRQLRGFSVLGSFETYATEDDIAATKSGWPNAQLNWGFWEICQTLPQSVTVI